MFDRDVIENYLQNKNFVMFVTSLFFMCGILAYFTSKELIFAIVITAFLILMMYLRLFDIKRIVILIAVFYCGFFLTFFKIKTYDDLLSLAPINSVFTGRIVSIPNSADKSKAKFFMNVETVQGENLSGKVFVTINGDYENIAKLNIGDRVSLEGRLREPFRASNPSQFDYSAYLKNFNTFTVLYVNDGLFKILDDEKSLKWKFLSKLNNTRNKILATHAKYLQSPNLEILGGIVFGDDAVAPPEYIKTSFINSGLLHILAASGMNVAFIFTFWFYILQFLRVPYRPRVISGMLMIVLYTLMTGLGPSVVRAALMLLFVLAGKLIDRDTHSVALLSFVAVLLLIYNPAYINDVSFQLSFMVTLGLLTTANVLSDKFKFLPNWFVAAILIPLVAQIWVAPIQMFYFNTFTLYSVLANISTVSLLSVICFCGFVSSILATIPQVADFICFTFDFYNNYLLDLLVWISNFFANLPHCIVQTTHPGMFQMILYYLMLISATGMIKFCKYKRAFLTIFFVGLVLVGLNLRFESKNLEIIAFDVQNADSFLIKTPQNKYFFIDTGKKAYQSGNSQAKIIMLKYLKDRGIKNIEGVIVTHFDNDHSGGAADIIKDTSVKTLYLNNEEQETQTAKNIFQAVRDIKQHVEIVKNNTVIYKEPDLKITNFKADIKGKNLDNERSTITLLSYKDFDMLFTGDAGVKSFEAVKKDIPHDIEVLKVGHHGASGVVDTEMVNYLGNRVSLISTGVNYFGHPTKGTLDVLRNTNIIRTDLLNSIKITTNGELYKIYSYNRNDKKYNLRDQYYSK
ncbi:DNA internalization-related competence protein ComEC/Rec2 [bacterium]|nr:DNA internalization-related competence protein ComEC/Rec2 [bacterium]